LGKATFRGTYLRFRRELSGIRIKQLIQLHAEHLWSEKCEQLYASFLFFFANNETHKYDVLLLVHRFPFLPSIHIGFLRASILMARKSSPRLAASPTTKRKPNEITEVLTR